METTEKKGYVNAHTRDGICEIEFGHPASNSLPGNLLKALAEAISASGADSNVRVIILRSSGDRAFCAGASFDELVAIKSLEEGKEFFSGFAKVINAMRKVPQLVIGRVQGKAVGGGVGLACAVDICYATAHASVKLSELAVGIGPFVVGPAVERKIGISAMSTLTIDASSWYSAEWAADRGMYAKVCADIPSLDAEVDVLAETLSKSNPEAMRQLKQIFWKDCQNWDTLLAERAAISGELVLSDFTRASIAAFKSGAR